MGSPLINLQRNMPYHLVRPNGLATIQGCRKGYNKQRHCLTMQQVICGLAGVIVANQEGEGGPDGVEHCLDVPADIDQQEAPCNPAAAEPQSLSLLCAPLVYKRSRIRPLRMPLRRSLAIPACFRQPWQHISWTRELHHAFYDSVTCGPGLADLSDINSTHMRLYKHSRWILIAQRHRAGQSNERQPNYGKSRAYLSQIPVLEALYLAPRARQA